MTGGDIDGEERGARRDSISRSLTRRRSAASQHTQTNPRHERHHQSPNRDVTTTSRTPGTGIHDGTYYPDGITPPEEKRQEDVEKDDLEATDSPEIKVESDDDEGRARRDFEVAELAKSLTRDSTWSNVPGNPFEAEKDSALDPHSPHFRARSWVKSMIKLNEAENKTPGRTAGFAFRNLNVHGFGAATDYQKDVGNIWLGTIGLAKKLLGLGRSRRIDILRDFEGLVESGDMLVVLGPPGSGCSTLLKTITGETHGFVVDKDSYMNYQGIPPNHMHKYFRGEAIYTVSLIASPIGGCLGVSNNVLTFVCRLKWIPIFPCCLLATL